MTKAWVTTTGLRSLLSAVWLGAAACHGLGRELVDAEPTPAGGGGMCEGAVPTCFDAPLPAEPVNLPPSAARVDDLACQGTAAPDCTLLAGAPLPDDSGPVACEAELPLEAGQEPIAALQALSCAALHVVNKSAAAPSHLLLVDASVERANVRIDSAVPLTIELQGAKLDHVWFELHGPIKLHLHQTRLFGDVRVSGAGVGAERAQVVLEDVVGRELSVGSEEQPFAGEIALWRSVLVHARVNAGVVSLESSVVNDAAFAVQRFEAADVTLMRLTLSAERTLISSGDVQDLELNDCRAFSAISGMFLRSRINGCEEPARLYGAAFSRGVLDGPLDLDTARVSATRIGLHTAGPIMAWDSSLSYTRFCAGARTIAFAGTSVVDCSRCEAPKAGEGLQACLVAPLDQVDMFASKEACAAFVAPPQCEPPEPRRMRKGE